MTCRSHLAAVLASLVLLALAACVDDRIGSPELDDPSSSTETTDKISLGGLVLHQEALARLSDEPLAGTLAPDLIGTAGGRALLEYVARCALPQGQSIHTGGATYDGLLGLAPEWLDDRCDGTCQRWVTGCLLAHANVLGHPVPISLRGPHFALAPSEHALASFTVREAAYYGNVFLPANDLLGTYACIGDGLFDVEDGTSAAAIDPAYLTGRVCGSGACGLQSTGLCHLREPARGACGFDAGAQAGYSECEGEGLHRDLFVEVVTVYLLD